MPAESKRARAAERVSIHESIEGTATMSAKAEDAMFTHVLIPTDGSKLSDKAIEKGVKFAKQIGAKVTWFYAVPEFRTFTGIAEMLEQTAGGYKTSAKKEAGKMLDALRQRAETAGVQCDAEAVFSDYPHEAIISMARKKKCDLIVMASHGRRGLSGVLLGSETQKVLTHSKLPVLVLR